MTRILIFLILITPSVYGQEVKEFFELGISANGYKGDLASAYEKWGSSFHLGYKGNIKKRVNIHFNLGIGNVTGQNPDYQFITPDSLSTTPNKFFKTKLITGNLDLQINLYKRKNFIVYLSQGIGITRFKVFDEENNALASNYSSRESNETYSSTAISLPTNIGFIYILPNGYGTGIQAGFLNPQSDYIDNISLWGSRAKKDNVLMYKFTLYVPLSFKRNEKVDKVKTAPLAPPAVVFLDNDKDGIENSKDGCPDEFGTIAYNGCPAPADSDGDGVFDKEDKCPDIAGVKENNGCPITPKDTDGDGITDDEDACPEVAGVMNNKGCPEIKKEDVVIIDKIKETLVFETGEARILPSSYPALDTFAEQLKNNPDATLQIEGHTDNTGEHEANIKLSLARAEEVKKYLVSKGVTEDRIKAFGIGSTRPIATNDTEEGKAQNRRVEIIMIYK